MELEVGMYVRTKNDKAVGNGVIGKIKYINEREFKGKLRKYYSVWTNDEDWFEILENDYVSKRVKASHNIIDLIEVGDIVTTKHLGLGKEYIEVIDNETSLEILKSYFKEKSLELISVVTKEQFSQMAYKIGD